MSDGRIDVFNKALDFAKQKGVGLLEATEVVEPNPLDLNNSSSYSNLFNCDLDGAILYQEAAMQQIGEIEDFQTTESEESPNQVNASEIGAFFTTLKNMLQKLFTR